MMGNMKYNKILRIRARSNVLSYTIFLKFMSTYPSGRHGECNGRVTKLKTESKSREFQKERGHYKSPF